ncbi:MAG TPA: hypothetical protein VN040_19180, partial [Pseudosphingobacterium sp.]|nr:hypothetical protein [Pseudosphingobacterium sp.]
GAYNWAIAQQKEDVVVMLNGEKKKGRVTAVNDNTIKFIYSGESLEYEFKKGDINQIEFASGRIELVNQNKSPAPDESQRPLASDADTKNKIAVLPFQIVSNDPTLTTEAMQHEIQTSCATTLRSEERVVQVQDPRTTNTILAKNNIKATDIDQLSPTEAARLLGVEYVVFGTYDIQNKGTVTSGSSSSTYKGEKKNEKVKGSEYASQNSYTTTTYSTKVELSLYNESGENVFSETRKPILGSLDSYNGALKYIAKRMPFGSKAKK